MKNAIILFSFLILSGSAFAQSIPNSSFETWETIPFPTYEEPPPWNTPNPYTSLIGMTTVTKSDIAWNGNYSARMETIEFQFGENTFYLFRPRKIQQSSKVLC